MRETKPAHAGYFRIKIRTVKILRMQFLYTIFIFFAKRKKNAHGGLKIEKLVYILR